MSTTLDYFSDLPCTETLSSQYIGINHLSADAELVISDHSFVQLKSGLSEISYSKDDYQYRTSASGLSNTDLLRFLKVVNDKIESSSLHFDRILEFGGSDLTLAKNFYGKVDNITVIDPISSQQLVPSDHKTSVEVLSKYDFEIDFSKYSKERVLVLSRHTIEHIKDVEQHFKVLSSQLNSSTVYIYEFPCIYSLISKLRFDAIFHQHLNYFDAYSFSNLITRYGFYVLDIIHNIRGSCGGSIQVVFSKTKPNFSLNIAYPYPNLSLEDYTSYYKNNKSIYIDLCTYLSGQIERDKFPVFGFGAALMLPTFFYHSHISPNLFHGIIDDDTSKHGYTYSNVPLKIFSREILSDHQSYSLLVTSNESFRAVYSACKTLEPINLYGSLLWT